MKSFFDFPAELGEYDPQEHTMGYISEFRFIPNQVTTHYNSHDRTAVYCQSFFYKFWDDVLWFVDWSSVLFCHVVVMMPS